METDQKEQKMHYADAYILNGLPITVGYYCDPPSPSLGIYFPTITIVALYDRNGRRAKWAENRMTDHDWRLLKDEIDRMEMV